MANLIVRGIDEALAQALKQRAARHGRSAEAEHRESGAGDTIAGKSFRRNRTIDRVAGFVDKGDFGFRLSRPAVDAGHHVT